MMFETSKHVLKTAKGCHVFSIVTIVLTGPFGNII